MAQRDSCPLCHAVGSTPDDCWHCGTTGEGLNRWCIACEQYEASSTGCGDEGFHRPILSGESMEVFRPDMPSWDRARRGRAA